MHKQPKLFINILPNKVYVPRENKVVMKINLCTEQLLYVSKIEKYLVQSKYKVNWQLYLT